MKYTITAEIKKLIQSTSFNKDTKDKLLEREFITYDDLIKIYKLQISSGGKFNNILSSFSKLTPIFTHKDPMKNKPTNKTAGYTKLMNRLKAEEQEKEYQSYLSKSKSKNVVNSSRSNDNAVEKIGQYSFLDKNNENQRSNVNSMAKEVKHQVTTIVNVLLTVFSASYAIWYWSGSSMNIDNSIRVLLSIFFGLLVLIAEVVVFSGYLKKVDEARVKEQNKKETKQVVETFTFGGKYKRDGKNTNNPVT